VHSNVCDKCCGVVALNAVICEDDADSGVVFQNPEGLVIGYCRMTGAADLFEACGECAQDNRVVIGDKCTAIKRPLWL